MNRIRTMRSATTPLLLLFAMLIAATAIACSSNEASTPTPGATAESTSTPRPSAPVATATRQPATPPVQPVATTAAVIRPTVDPRVALFATVPGIVDPSNLGWPRMITTTTGTIEIEAPPERVYSLSLGHAEIVAALRGGNVLVATASFFKDPGTSAAYTEFVGLPDAGSDPEEIIGLDPQIVIASAFTSADLVAQLTGVGVKVIRADLEDSAIGNVPNILLLGYMLGAEDRAIELAGEVRSRVLAVTDRIDSSSPVRPRVLAMSRFSDIFVAGKGSTEGGIIEAAGALNVAAEAGVNLHQNVGIEGIATMNPDIILLTQPEQSALDFADDLYDDPALAAVPAIVNRQVIFGDPTFFTTLSHWNVRGIEESALIFYPELFAGVTFSPFTHPVITQQ